MSKKPAVLSEHLMEAIHWAKESYTKKNLIPGTSCNKRYNQANWTCGTACCMHGAAHLIATGEEVVGPPKWYDYPDLPDSVRAGVISVLFSPNGTPELLEDALTGVITIGEHVGLGKGISIGQGTKVADYVEIGDGVKIGENCNIDLHVSIEERSIIGANTSIMYDTRIADDVFIGNNVIIGERSRILSQAEIEDGVTIEPDSYIRTNAIVG